MLMSAYINVNTGMLMITYYTNMRLVVTEFIMIIDLWNFNEAFISLVKRSITVHQQKHLNIVNYKITHYIQIIL